MRQFPESKETKLNNLVKQSLLDQQKKMLARNPKRENLEQADIKYKILVKFNQSSRIHSFDQAFFQLDDTHKHAIITRL